MTTIQKEVYDAFIAAGTPEEKADAAARALSKNPQDMATRSDLHTLKIELESKLAELETKLTWRMVTLTGLVLAAVGTATAYLTSLINKIPF